VQTRIGAGCWRTPKSWREPRACAACAWRPASAIQARRLHERNGYRVAAAKTDAVYGASPAALAAS
jgi:hypothetical protein